MELLVGAVVSLITQIVKKYLPGTIGSLAALLGISLLAGAGMYYLQFVGYWETVLQIAMSASFVWGLFIHPFEGRKEV